MAPLTAFWGLAAGFFAARDTGVFVVVRLTGADATEAGILIIELLRLDALCCTGTLSQNLQWTISMVLMARVYRGLACRLGTRMCYELYGRVHEYIPTSSIKGRIVNIGAFGAKCCTRRIDVVMSMRQKMGYGSCRQRGLWESWTEMRHMLRHRLTGLHDRHGPDYQCFSVLTSHKGILISRVRPGFQNR